MQDTTEHLWRTATAPITSSTNLGDAAQGREYREIVTRVPAKLEEGLMKEPRMIHGVPRISERMRHPGNFSRKGVAPSSRDRTPPASMYGHAALEQANGNKDYGERDMRRETLKDRLNGLNLNPT